MNAEQSTAAKPTIFAVDDDASVLDSVAIALRRVDAPLECFHSAEDFLDLWGGPRPGCLVLDIRMNGMSGIELHQKLTQEHDYLSVVMVTGHATVPLSVDAMKRGAISVLEKPYSPEQLRQVVNDGLKLSADLWQRNRYRADYELKRSSLSPREQEVYRLLLEGHENKQIGLRLDISLSTVEKHRLAVVKKMGTDNITQLFGQKFEATGTIHDSWNDDERID